MTLKGLICTSAGILAAWISELFGGWDSALTTLVVCMGFDYVTGLIVAGVFNESPKTESGGLKSTVGWQGICKKAMTLGWVLIACRLDMLLGTAYIKDAVVTAFCVNELISITENAGIMGVPMPKVIIRAIDVLKSTEEDI